MSAIPVLPRIGVVVLPDLRWPVACQVWRDAEALGFHSAWTYDHLTWRTMRDGPWLGAVPLLAAVAASTSTLRIGTMVASPNFRHPVTFAKEVMTLDEVSGGRFTLGFGAGGTGWDADALGQQPWTPAERTARFVEFVDHLDVLLTASAVDRLDGTFYAARDARNLPGCVQSPRVPFAIAASGPRGMRTVAQHAHTWITLGALDRTPDTTWADEEQTLRAQMDLLVRSCEAEGRDASTVDRLLMLGENAAPWLVSADAFVDLCGRVAALGFTDVAVHRPRPEPPYAGDLGHFSSVMSAALAEVGR